MSDPRTGPGDDLHLGIDFLDDEHRQLLELVGAWSEAVAVNADPGKADDLFERLLDFARRHFLVEEHDMASRSYHGSQAHQREHEALMERLDNLRISAGYDLAGEFAGFIYDWAAEHIRTMDRQYAEFLKSQER